MKPYQNDEVAINKEEIDNGLILRLIDVFSNSRTQLKIENDCLLVENNKLKSDLNALEIELALSKKQLINLPQWISIEDQLPCYGDEILFYCTDLDVYRGWYSTSNEFMVSHDGLVAEDSSIESVIDQTKVTHWHLVIYPTDL